MLARGRGRHAWGIRLHRSFSSRFSSLCRLDGKRSYEDAGAPSYVRVVARAREPRDGRVRDPRAGTGRRGRRRLSAGPALQLARRPRHRPAGVPGQPLHPPPRRARTPPPRARLPAASPVSPSSGAPVHEWDVVRTQRADAVLGMGGGSTMAAATARVPRPRPATAARTSHASRQLEFAFGEPPTSSTEIGAEETHAADPVPVPDATECITAEAPCWRGRPALGARAIAVGRRRRTTRASAPIIGGHPVRPTAQKHPGRICGRRRHRVRRRFGLARARRGRPGSTHVL